MGGRNSRQFGAIREPQPIWSSEMEIINLVLFHYLYKYINNNYHKTVVRELRSKSLS